MSYTMMGIKELKVADHNSKTRTGYPSSEELQALRDEMPPTENKKELKAWWKANSKDWGQRLRAWGIKYRNLGHDWDWDNKQTEILENYWQANRFLLECMAPVVVQRDVRDWIEDTMFLPQSQLDQLSPPQ